MVRCNDRSQLEVHLSYDSTNNEWHRLPEAKIISIIEESSWYKRSRTNRFGGDTSSVAISEITTSNANYVNTVRNQLQILQQIISAVKT